MSLLEDISSLKEKPVPEVRETIAEKVSTLFVQGAFDSSEGQIAGDIIRMLARDVEVRVRSTLSHNLKNSNDLPRDIAVRLAHDILEVSIPILEFSTVLTDEDVIEIIRSTKQVAKLLAISRRKNMSNVVSSELVKTVNEDVIVSLFENGSAKISQGSLEFVFNEFRGSGRVVAALVSRGELSVVVVEKILNAVSAEIRKELMQKHNLDEKKANVLAKSTQERVTLGLLEDIDEPKVEEKPVQAKASVKEQEQPSPSNKVLQTENLVNHLFKEGRLTESMILRSLCEGNLLFFEVSMARRAGIPIMNARVLMQDGNSAALRSLWRRAKMPDSVFEAMNVIVNFAVKNAKNPDITNNYSHKLLEHIHEKGYDKTLPLMQYVMALISSKVQIRDII